MSRLWRVDVAGVSHRFVDAETGEQAIEQVRQVLMEAIDLQVSPADSAVASVYLELGPLQKKNAIAALDGLASPSAEKGARSARRRLARLVKFNMELREWARTSTEESRGRPVDPEAMGILLRHFELNSMRRVRARLRDFERELYGDEAGGNAPPRT